MGLEKKQAAAIGPCELFGFGSGDFAIGPEASDIMGDSSGRWLNYLVKSGSEHCVVEADKRLPEHIKKADFFNKVSLSLNFTFQV